MPLYEFRCTTCNNVEEHLFHTVPTLPLICNECGGSMYLIPSMFNNHFNPTKTKGKNADS